MTTLSDNIKGNIELLNSGKNANGEELTREETNAINQEIVSDYEKLNELNQRYFSANSLIDNSSSRLAGGVGNGAGSDTGDSPYIDPSNGNALLDGSSTPPPLNITAPINPPLAGTHLSPTHLSNNNEPFTTLSPPSNLLDIATRYVVPSNLEKYMDINTPLDEKISMLQQYAQDNIPIYILVLCFYLGL